MITAGPATVDDNQWHHAAFALTQTSSSGVRTYKDGVLKTSIWTETSTPRRVGSVSNSKDLRFGWGTGDFNHQLRGSLDKLQMGKRALSAEEIRTLYAAGPNLCLCLNG